MSKTISAVQSSEYVLFSSGNPLSITTSGGVETNGGTAIYGAATQAWTITNAGTVSGGSPASSLGIDLKAGGTIGNTGRISGAHYAIRIRGAAGMVTNAGSITSATDGVVLFAGGSVSNAVGGVITGTGNVGVYISGGAGTVTNSGTISGAPDAVQFVGAFADRMIIDPGAVFSGKVDGGNTIGAAAVSTLELASAASIGTLTGLGSKYVNFAQVTVDSGAQWVLSGSNAIVTGATLTNAGTLLDNGTLNGGGTLVNNGSISVAVAGGVSLSGGAITNSVHGTISAYNGIAVTGGGSVSNAGTIAGTGSDGYGVSLKGGSLTNQQSGTIEGIYTGVITNGGTVTNDGVIDGIGAIAEGVQALDGGLIVNAANATITAPNFIAVAIYSVPGTVSNAGVISGDGAGIILFDGGTVTNLSGGTITGGSFGVQGLNVASTVINAGTISAATAGDNAVSLAGGYKNRVVIDPGAVFSAVVNGGNGVGAAVISTLELASAASIGTLTGLGSKYVNLAQVTVDSGAQWVLSGSNAIVTGATLTNAGTLLDNGTLNGGGTLVNNGSISVAVAGGVSLSGGAITNSVHGTISAYNGIAVTGGGSVSNAGTIAGTGSDGYGVSLKGGSLTNQQSGTIEGIYTGVITNGGTVTNDGVIDGIGAIAEGVQALDGGLIVNAANATITAPNFIAVAIYSVPGTVSNAGVISGDGAGIILFDGGTVTNLSGGTITGGSFGVQGLNVASTVINAGTISAATAGDNAVSLAGGYKNRVVIDPGAVFSGVVNGGNGVGAAVVSTLELASAASIGTLTGLGSKYVNLAQVTVDTGAQWVLTGSNTIGAGVTLTLNSASLTATGTLVDNGSILLDPSTLTVGELTGTGTVSIGAGGMLTVEERVSGGQTIDFAGASGLLTLDTPRGDSGTIAGFVAGDTIDLVGVNQVTSTKIVNGNTLQVSLGNGMPIDLPMSGNFSGEFFHHATTGSNTDITVNTTPCFCRGTLIRTDRGEVPVEALAIGDRVVTLSGAARPIRWIGQRRFDLMRHPTPERVRPIRILADAFADGAPRRDLFVSPDHAVLRDGVLVPARLLLNGASVRRDTVCRSVAYYHIELDAHDILLAEDLAVESYLDTGNRGMFENAGGAMVLHPDLINDQARREAESCLPFAGDAARVEPIWRALVARAVRLGWQLPPAPETTDDPALHLLVDGRRVAPISVAPVSVTQAWRHTFIVPRADAAVRLVSRWAVPSEVCPWIGDNRSLGVMLSGLLVRIGAMVEPIPLDHPDLTEGWWQPEWNGKVTLRRWTNGDAEVRMLSAALAAPGPCLLEVEVAAAMPYSLPASVVHRRSTAIHGKAPVEPADRFAERSMAFPLATPKLSIAG